MLYLPEMLNQHGLFLHVNGLKKGDQRLSDLKESIFNHGTDAILRMERIRSLRMRILREFDLFADQITDAEEVIVYASSSMGALLNEVAPLFSTLRVLQNRVLALVSLWEGVSVPSSINDYCKQPEKYKVSGSVKKLISDYWERSGKHVKFYRDLEQHEFSEAILTARYFMRLKPDRNVLVEIPDYQDSIKRSELAYENGINALEFLDDACFELHRLLEEIAQHYGGLQTPHTESVRLSQLGELTPWRNRTLSLLYSEKITQNADGRKLNLSAVRIGQNDEGKVVVQKMLLEGPKLQNAASLYGVKTVSDDEDEGKAK